jgi:hypothetical protein
MSGCKVAGDTWHDGASHGNGGHDRVIVAQTPPPAQAVVVDTNQVADASVADAMVADASVADASQEQPTVGPDTLRRVAG